MVVALPGLRLAKNRGFTEECLGRRDLKKERRRDHNLQILKYANLFVCFLPIESQQKKLSSIEIGTFCWVYGMYANLTAGAFAKPDMIRHAERKDK
jgi:hypothetical protein